MLKLISSVLAFCWLGSALAETASAPAGRAGSVINTFQVMCTLQPIDFSRLDAKAAAMRMQVIAAPTDMIGNEQTTRRKIWAGSLTNGPFGLLIDETTEPSVKAESCAITAEVPDTAAFIQETKSTLRLKDAPTIRIQGETTFYVWTKVYAPSDVLIVGTSGKHPKSILIKLQTRSAAI